jgi:hypothetical protein
VDRAISLMTASDWRKYWGPLIRLVPIAIVGFELEGLGREENEVLGEDTAVSCVASHCRLIVPVIRCRWGDGSHWSFQPLMNLSHRVDSVRQALGRMTPKDWAVHWGSTLVKLCHVFSRL